MKSSLYQPSCISQLPLAYSWLVLSRNKRYLSPRGPRFSAPNPPNGCLHSDGMSSCFSSYISGRIAVFCKEYTYRRIRIHNTQARAYLDAGSSYSAKCKWPFPNLISYVELLSAILLLNIVGCLRKCLFPSRPNSLLQSFLCIFPSLLTAVTLPQER